MSLTDGSLYATRDYLLSLRNCSLHREVDPSTLLEELLFSLGRDGFKIKEIGDLHRNLRGLSESSGGGVNVTALVMVAVCIIFAGLASGLTQVLLFSVHTNMKLLLCYS